MNYKKIIIMCVIVFLILFGVESSIFLWHLNQKENMNDLNENSKEVYNEKQDIDKNDWEVNITIGTNILKIDNSTPENTIYELEEAYINKDIYFAVTSSLSNFSIYINDEVMTDSSSIKINELSSSNLLDLVVECDKEKKHYQIRTLPLDFPILKLTGKIDYIGDFYGDLSASEENEKYYIYKMSTKGEIEYYKSGKMVLRNFEKWNIKEKVYYSYFEQIKDYDSIQNGAYCQGQYIIMNEDYNIIDTANIVESEKVGKEYAEQHDFYMIDEGQYILMAYIVRNPQIEHCNNEINLFAGSRILAAYIQENRDGNIVWDWISSDYPDFYTGCVETSNFQNVDYSYAIDYFHVNSINIDPKDDNLIISARNQDSIIKINRKTGEILWTLGGINDQFGLTDDEKFSRQHYAYFVGNGNLLLFDNGYENGISRVVEMELDEQNLKVLEYKEYSLGIFGKYCGSVRKMEDSRDVYCIGWGYKINSYSLMSVVDFETGQVLGELISKTNVPWAYRIVFFE